MAGTRAADEQIEIKYKHPIDKGGWAIVYHAITLDKRLRPHGVFRLYVLLHKYAQQSGKAWPKRSTLAADLGVSEDSVWRWMRKLEQVGLVERRKERFTGPPTIYLLDPHQEYFRKMHGDEERAGASFGGDEERAGASFGGDEERAGASFGDTKNALARHEQYHDHDDDDNKRAAEKNQTTADEILRAVWEGTIGRPASPEEIRTLQELTEFCPTTRLLALIPNLALRVGRESLTIAVLRAAAMGDLSVSGLEAALPSAPEPPPAPPSPPPSDRWGGDPVLAEVVAMYEDEIGPITQMVAEELRAMTADVRDLARWREAFRAAVAANVRRWSYVRACLRGGDGRGRTPVIAPTAPPARAPTRGGASRAVRARVVRPEDMPPMPDEEPLPPPD